MTRVAPHFPSPAQASAPLFFPLSPPLGPLSSSARYAAGQPKPRLPFPSFHCQLGPACQCLPFPFLSPSSFRYRDGLLPQPRHTIPETRDFLANVWSKLTIKALRPRRDPLFLSARFNRALAAVCSAIWISPGTKLAAAVALAIRECSAKIDLLPSSAFG